jgi:hypothetical protein
MSLFLNKNPKTFENYFRILSPLFYGTTYKTCSHSKRSRPQCNTDTCNMWQRAACWQGLLLGKLELPPAEVHNSWWHDNIRYLDINLQTLPVTICTTNGITFNNCTLCPLTHSMVQSASSETNRFAACQEIPQFSLNPMFHYRTHKCPPTLCILFSPVQSIHPHSTSWRSVLILFTNLRLGVPIGLLSVFPNKTL